jgi:hypothetical protein
LDRIADYLQFISNTQLFWLMLNTKAMTMAAKVPVDSVWRPHTVVRLLTLLPPATLRPIVNRCPQAVSSPAVIGHGNQSIAKWWNSLNRLLLVFDGDSQAPPGSSKSFQRF